MITLSIFWALVFALFVTKTEQPNEYEKKSRKSFRARRRWHDPMLALNMSVFNSDSGWNRIFSPVPVVGSNHIKMQDAASFVKGRRKIRRDRDVKQRFHTMKTTTLVTCLVVAALSFSACSRKAPTGPPASEVLVVEAATRVSKCRWSTRQCFCSGSCGQRG
jgi:hypothetical protein